MPSWPKDVRPITGADFSDVFASAPIVAVHCWASWNAHDHAFARELNELAPQFRGRVSFYTLDLENASNHELIKDWPELVNLPALVVFDGGQWLKTFVHAQEPVSEFARKIQLWLEEHVSHKSDR